MNDSRIRYIRKSTPVHQWKLSFSGDNLSKDPHNQNIHDFIAQLEVFRRAEHIAEGELLDQMIHLLRGKARQWYQNVYNDIYTWPQFIDAIKGRFLSHNYNFEILREIQNRLQRKDESVRSYINEIESRFRAMPDPPTDSFKIFTIQQNLLPFYSMPLATYDIRSVQELEDLCTKIESSKNHEARRYRLDPRSRPTKPENKTRVHSKWSTNAIDEESDETTNSDDSSVREIAVIQKEKRNSKVSQKRKSGPKENSKEREKRTTNEEKGEQKPISKCYNCLAEGHLWRDCSEPKKTNFCYRCGKQGVTSKECEECPRRVAFLDREEEPGLQSSDE